MATTFARSGVNGGSIPVIVSVVHRAHSAKTPLTNRLQPSTNVKLQRQISVVTANGKLDSLTRLVLTSNV